MRKRRPTITDREYDQLYREWPTLKKNPQVAARIADSALWRQTTQE